MKVLNLIWAYSLGAGIDKCYLTYAKLGEMDSDIYMKNVCINLLNLNSHIEPLKEIGVDFIDIKSRSDFSWIAQLQKMIEQEKPDIVFTHGFNGAIIMLIERIFKGVKIPLVCTYHGAYHAPTLSKKVMEPIYNGLMVFIYKHFAKKVICVENVSRSFLLNKGVDKDKVITVHNGIPDIDEPSAVDLSKYVALGVPTIITASRITEVKGLPYLLEALKILKDKAINFHYFMIGEGPDLNMLKARAKELGVNDNITFVGYQNNVSEWLTSCDIFALPSLYEYHSIAVLEAMRAGKAIVATTVGGNSESIRDGIDGILVPPKDAKAFAEGLEQLLKERGIIPKYGESAKLRFQKEFTEKAMMQNLINVLKS